jgi:hypothetical protein
MILFTDNLTTTEVGNVTDDEIIGSISLKTQAGQVSDNSFFRVGVDSDPYDDPYGSIVPITIWTNDPAITLSTDSVRGFGPATQQAIEPGKIGSTVFVKVTADLDATEGDRTGQVFVNGEIMTVHYFVASADKGDTENSPMDRLAGDDTYSVLEQFETQGEALELVRYDPLPKPAPLVKGALYPWQAMRNRNVTEWTNPNNAQVGYAQTIYYAKGFIGDNDLVQNLQYGMPVDLQYGDAEQVLLPADFVGFDPTPYHERTFFSQLTPTQKAWQRTQWTVNRHDGEYALVNIRRQKYYRGQLMFFAADLQRVNYPGGDSTQGFLPWSQLYDDDGKVIGYVPGFSRAEIEDAYCPYHWSPSLFDAINAAIEETATTPGDCVCVGPRGPAGPQGPIGPTGPTPSGQPEDLEYDNGNVSGAVSLDWENSRLQRLTLTGSATLTLNNPSPGTYILRVIQGNTSSNSISFPATFHWEGGSANEVQPTTGLNRETLYVLYYVEGYYYVSALADMR